MEAGEFSRRCKTLDVPVTLFASDREDLCTDTDRKQGEAKSLQTKGQGALG